MGLCVHFAAVYSTYKERQNDYNYFVVYKKRIIFLSQCLLGQFPLPPKLQITYEK